ncbi:MAG TPA: phenylalanine--tRNA ligase subunit beta, partial [Candidatus Polarisedimenticolaceae bacterium]|nr:phenylalanine--tRNA ligase subunit beta [Candidatus Polarisedimenticolaceae bacterium]
AACGLRSINNVVDASNLVMLELGQPVHFFDLARWTGSSIGVRAARAGERLTTLDGVERDLQPGMVVITDGSGPVALGGVMGGAATEIREATKDVLIEAAWFVPAAVRRTARGLGLVTDASQRFERGADPEAPPLAQDLAALWLSDLAGGRPAPGTIDRRARSFEPKHLTVRLARAATLLGYRPDPQESVSALASIELAPQRDGDTIAVTVPSWRVDLAREADVVEEIGRALGYDKVPTALPASAPRASAAPPPPIEDAVRDRLASRGFHETIQYAMIAPGEDDAFVAPGASPPIPLENPISASLAVLRRSLLPGLIRSADQNVRRGIADVRLFEVGRVFLGARAGGFPDEPLRAGFVWEGASAPPHWSTPTRPADAYDAGGLVEDVLALAASSGPFRRERASLGALHPGQSIVWRDPAGRAVAWCGALHPALSGTLAFPAPPLVGEIDLSALGPALPGPVTARPVPNLPAASRDLSLVLDRRTSASAVVDALSRVPSPAPASFAWLDRYEGPGLGPDEVSMTLRVILQPRERTLLDAETETYRQALIAALSAVEGARLRRTEA